MSRSKTNINYREESIIPLSPADLKENSYILCKPYVTWFGSQYEAGKEWIFNNEYEFVILEIHEFEVLMTKDGIIPRIIGVLMTKDGITRSNAFVLKSQCPFEFWISSIKGIEQQLLSIKWIDSVELKQYRLPSSFRLKYKVNQILYHTPIIYCLCARMNLKKCKCHKIPKCVKSRIQIANRPKYMGELEPPYFLFIWSTKIKSSWSSAAQLHETEPSDHQFETLEDIIYSNIIAFPSYKNYCLLGINNVPLDIQISSAYYLKTNVYLADKEIIDLPKANVHKFYYQYKKEITHLLNKTFMQTIKYQILSKNVKNRATKYNLLKYGAHCSEYKFEFNYKPYFKSLNVIFIDTKSYIGIQLDLAQVANIRGDLDISKYNDGSKCELLNNIYLKFIRKTTELFVQSFSYVCKNRHVVQVQNDVKESSNEKNQNVMDLDDISESELF